MCKVLVLNSGTTEKYIKIMTSMCSVNMSQFSIAVERHHRAAYKRKHLLGEHIIIVSEYVKGQVGMKLEQWLRTYL